MFCAGRTEDELVQILELLAICKKNEKKIGMARKQHLKTEIFSEFYNGFIYDFKANSHISGTINLNGKTLQKHHCTVNQEEPENVPGCFLPGIRIYKKSKNTFSF